MILFHQTHESYFSLFSPLMLCLICMLLDIKVLPKVTSVWSNQKCYYRSLLCIYLFSVSSFKRSTIFNEREVLDHLDTVAVQVLVPMGGFTGEVKTIILLILNWCVIDNRQCRNTATSLTLLRYRETAAYTQSSNNLPFWKTVDEFSKKNTTPTNTSLSVLSVKCQLYAKFNTVVFFSVDNES